MNKWWLNSFSETFRASDTASENRLHFIFTLCRINNFAGHLTSALFRYKRDTSSTCALRKMQLVFLWPGRALICCRSMLRAHISQNHAKIYSLCGKMVGFFPDGCLAMPPESEALPFGIWHMSKHKINSW